MNQSSKRKITQSSLEVAALIRHLTEGGGSKSGEVLRSIRKLLKKGAQLPEYGHVELFQTFYQLLTDLRWKVVCECTLLMVDIVPQMGDYELDHCMGLVLPRAVPNLGHESTDVRRASLRLIHVYMRYTNNLQKVLRTYVQYGLENIEKPAQKGAVLSLPLLFTEEFSNENLFPLVQALSELLVSSDTALFYPVFLALQRLHVLVGNDSFKIYLDHVTPDARLLYQKVLSRNSTANSGGRSETGNLFESGSEENNNDRAIQMDKIIGGEDAPKPPPIDPSSCDAVAGSFETATLDSSNFGPDFSYTLEWGLFTRMLIAKVNSENFADKIEALQTMVTIFRDSTMSQMALFSSHLDDFITRFLNKMYDDSNFKINLYALDMTLVIIERLKANAINYMAPLVSLVVRRLGDNRAVVREHAIKIAHNFPFNLPAQHVLETFLEHKYHRSPKVREEIVNRVTGALLTFPRSDFALPKLCYEISPMLVDSKRLVRLAALECLAVIAQALGHQHLGPLYGAVQSVENQSEADGLFNAVQARLARRDLPRVHADGTIRYVLNLVSYSGWFASEQDADLEWVMMASSSNSNTPPKLPSHHATGGRRSRNLRKGHVKPMAQVSFEQTDMSSDNGHGGGVRTEIDTRRATIAPDSLPGSLPGHEKESDRGISTSSSNGSVKSDDSKGRELWRYYFHKFKQHITGSCSTANSERSRTANFSKKAHYGSTIGGRTIVEPRRSSSASSSASADSISNNKHLDDKSHMAVAGTIKRHDRVLSMPTITSGPLSDISERQSEVSYEGSTRTAMMMGHKPPERHQQSAMKQQPPSGDESPPLSPTKSKQTTLDVIPEGRSKSVSETPALSPALQQGSSPRRKSMAPVHFEDQQPSRSLSPAKEASGGELSTGRPTSGRDRGRTPSPTKILEEPLSAPTTRPSSPGSGPASPTNLAPETNLRKMSTAGGSMPAISLPQLDSGKPSAGDGEGNDDQLGNDQGSQLDKSDAEAKDDYSMSGNKRDAQTQKDDYSEYGTSGSERTFGSLSMKPGAASKAGGRRMIRKRISRSISPAPKVRQSHLVRQLQPAIPANANIRSILETVAKTEGPFENPDDALRAAISAFTQDAWTTKVEGMLAITRLATFHPSALQREMHTIIGALVYEVKNLRSSVARSAIFTLGELFTKMRKHVEPDMDAIGQALLHKCGENITFIREDIDKALSNMIEEMPQSKSAITLITNGANHRNMNVRRTTAHYLATLVEQMGANKVLMGPREVAAHLFPAAARFVQDGSPHTRYYGRRIFSLLLPHPSFDKLLRKYLSPGTFRNIVGILESIKRRGIGDKPPDVPTKT